MIPNINIPPGWRLVRLPGVAEVDRGVLTALEAIWARIREAQPSVPPVTFDLQPSRTSGCTSVEWSTSPVIVLNLKDGRGPDAATLPARDVLTTLLHLAAHAASGGQAGSEGRYHSPAFAEAARQLGLEVSKERVAGVGYRPEGLAHGTMTRYDLGQLDRALKAWKPEILRQRSRGPVTFQCSCTPRRSVFMNQGVYDRGTVTCGVCGELFLPTG